MVKLACQSTDIGYQIRALERLDRSMTLMRMEGIPETSTPFSKLFDIRSKVASTLGFKVPRNVSSLMRLFGLSPGTLQLWHDDESGFFTEARAKPGAPPVYHHVEDDVAMTILKGDLTHDQFQQLKMPDEYIGE